MKSRFLSQHFSYNCAIDINSILFVPLFCGILVCFRKHKSLKLLIKNYNKYSVETGVFLLFGLLTFTPHGLSVRESMYNVVEIHSFKPGGGEQCSLDPILFLL